MAKQETSEKITVPEEATEATKVYELHVSQQRIGDDCEYTVFKTRNLTNPGPGDVFDKRHLADIINGTQPIDVFIVDAPIRGGKAS